MTDLEILATRENVKQWSKGFDPPDPGMVLDVLDYLIQAIYPCPVVQHVEGEGHDLPANVVPFQRRGL